MGERRSNRGINRTDKQILAHAEDVDLLRAIASGRLTTAREHRWALQRLAREDCVLAGNVSPILLPRGQRIVAAANGEVPGSVGWDRVI